VACLSREVAAKMLKSPEVVKRGGGMRDMTILVSHLQGFAASTECMEASRIVALINRYLEKMIPIIMRHEGTTDYFTGDVILAFFGAPRLLPDPQVRAVACAVEMLESMQELNKENLRLDFPEFEMGIGITCEQLVVGYIGSEKRKKCGVAAGLLNVAFALVAKARPREIVATQSVKDRLGEKLHTGSHWNDYVEGIGNTLIYRVIGIR